MIWETGVRTPPARTGPGGANRRGNRRQALERGAPERGTTGHVATGRTTTTPARAARVTATGLMTAIQGRTRDTVSTTRRQSQAGAAMPAPHSSPGTGREGSRGSTAATSPAATRRCRRARAATGAAAGLGRVPRTRCGERLVRRAARGRERRELRRYRHLPAEWPDRRRVRHGTARRAARRRYVTAVTRRPRNAGPAGTRDNGGYPDGRRRVRRLPRRPETAPVTGARPVIRHPAVIGARRLRASVTRVRQGGASAASTAAATAITARLRSL